MKKTRHTYHYTVRRLKRNKTQAIKLKLAEKSNDSASFWQEIKKLNPNNSILPDIVDDANTDEDITNVFKEKYKEIYTSVPTDDMELKTISQDINNLVLTSSNNDSCYITPSIAGLGSSTVDQVLKYTKYPKFIPSTSTGQVLIF